jgi:hypothetical protein
MQLVAHLLVPHGLLRHRWAPAAQQQLLVDLCGHAVFDVKDWMVPKSGARADQRLFRLQVLHSDIDLLNPPAELERTKHKLKRLVQSPNSFFMDVKCTGCFSM